MFQNARQCEATKTIDDFDRYFGQTIRRQKLTSLTKNVLPFQKNQPQNERKMNANNEKLARDIFFLK